MMIKDWIVIQTYIHIRDKNRPVPKLEPIIALNGEASYFYALRVLHGRFKAGENEIAKNPFWAVKYARFIMQGRFKRAEKHIAQNPELCYDYFKHVMKTKLPKEMHQAMTLLSYSNPNNKFISKYFKELDND